MADAPLTKVARVALARAFLQAVIRGEDVGPLGMPWSDADILVLAEVARLGRPAEVVAGLPPVVIAPGDTWGGREGTPLESFAAAALHVYRIAARRAGVPMAAPHDFKTTAGG